MSSLQESEGPRRCTLLWRTGNSRHLFSLLISLLANQWTLTPQAKSVTWPSTGHITVPILLSWIRSNVPFPTSAACAQTVVWPQFLIYNQQGLLRFLCSHISDLVSVNRLRPPAPWCSRWSTSGREGTWVAAWSWLKRGRRWRGSCRGTHWKEALWGKWRVSSQI